VRHQILHNPDFGVIQIQFDQPGEQVISESGAMVARDTAIEMKTNLQGGLGGALKRKLLGGESLFQNTFTCTAPGQTLWIAPAPEGAIECITLQPGQEMFLQSGAYLASTPGITLDTKWQGAKGFFSGGLFLLPTVRASSGSPHTAGSTPSTSVSRTPGTSATTRTWSRSPRACNTT